VKSYTLVSLEVIDVIMPRVSGAAFKVFCAVMRQTLGWADKSSPIGRKRWDVISYTQFMEKTGITSKTTISKAISELLKHGYIQRVPTGKSRGAQKQPFAYQVNPIYWPMTSTENGLVTSPENEVATAKNGLVTSPENEVATAKNGLVTSPENGHTILNKSKTVVVDKTLLESNQSEIRRLLAEIGISESMAKSLSQKSSLENVRDWVAYGSTLAIKDLAAFVVNQLETGKAVPIGRLFKDD
jgi:hypothetical protein